MVLPQNPTAAELQQSIMSFWFKALVQVNYPDLNQPDEVLRYTQIQRMIKIYRIKRGNLIQQIMTHQDTLQQLQQQTRQPTNPHQFQPLHQDIQTIQYKQQLNKRIEKLENRIMKINNILKILKKCHYINKYIPQYAKYMQVCLNRGQIYKIRKIMRSIGGFGVDVCWGW